MTGYGSVAGYVQVCDEYFLKMRRQVYQTPKSYLSFIQNFKGMYMQKLKELQASPVPTPQRPPMAGGREVLTWHHYCCWWR